MATSGSVIDIQGLSLTFQTSDGPVYALDEINLAIQRGEFVSFIGPSGCGKTTLLRVIADLEQPTAGTIEVNGVSPEQARLARAYGYGVSGCVIVSVAHYRKKILRCHWK